MSVKTPASSSWLKIGRVGKAHGLRGDFFVSGREEPIPKYYGKVFVGETADTARLAVIEKSGWMSERPVLKCSLAHDRTAADSLSGLPIWIDSALVKVNDDTEYLWSDLEGRQVNDSAGVQIGRVRSVYNAGAGDVVEIEDQNGRLLGVPMISQYVDMSFKHGEAELALAVEADFFSDLWQELKPDNSTKDTAKAGKKSKSTSGLSDAPQAPKK